MSTETTEAPTTSADPSRVLSDLELLHRFIGQKLQSGRRDQPLEECLTEFRRYLASVERLRDEIRPALERSRRGQYGKELDVEDLIRRGRQRLADRGSPTDGGGVAFSHTVRRVSIQNIQRHGDPVRAVTPCQPAGTTGGQTRCGTLSGKGVPDHLPDKPTETAHKRNPHTAVRQIRGFLAVTLSGTGGALSRSG